MSSWGARVSAVGLGCGGYTRLGMTSGSDLATAADIVIGQLMTRAEPAENPTGAPPRVSCFPPTPVEAKQLEACQAAGGKKTSARTSMLSRGGAPGVSGLSKEV
jgi:hypothetical protein